MIVKKSKATTKTKKPVVKAHRGMAHVAQGSQQDKALQNFKRDQRNRMIMSRNKDAISKHRSNQLDKFNAMKKKLGITEAKGKNNDPAALAKLQMFGNRLTAGDQRFMSRLGVRQRPMGGLNPRQQQQLKQRQQVTMMKAQLKQQKNISPQRRAEMEAFIKASTPTRAPDQRARFTDRAKLARDRFNKQAQPTPTAPTPSSKPTGINRKKAIQDAQIQYRDMLKKQMEQRNKRQKQNEQRVKATKMPATPATQKTVPTRTPRKPQVDPKARTPQKKRPTGTPRVPQAQPTPRVPQAQPTPRAPTPRRRRFRFRGRR